jgi:PAS domain S-box-containing protein
LLLNKAVIDTANEGIVVTDRKNRIIDVNPAFTLITGYEREDVLGKNPSLMSSGRHDEAFYQEIWHELLTVGRWSGELWNRRRNGEIYPEWISMTSIKDEAGQPQYYVGIFSDISERKAAEIEAHHQANSDVLTNLALWMLIILNKLMMR